MSNQRYGAYENDGRAGYARDDQNRDYERDREEGRGYRQDRLSREDGFEREQRSFAPRHSQGGDPYGDYGQGSERFMDRDRHRGGHHEPGAGWGRQGSYGLEHGSELGRLYSGDRSGGGDYAERGGYGSSAGSYQGYAGQGSGRGGSDRGPGLTRGSGFGPENPMLANLAEGRRPTEGPHRGRGPKTYVRSDERIREDVNDRLSDHHHLDASEIDVQVKDGEVTLSGHVDDRHAKRMAEDCAEAISGVKHVQNNLRVKPDQSAQPSTAFPAGAASATQKGREN